MNVPWPSSVYIDVEKQRELESTQSYIIGFSRQKFANYLCVCAKNFQIPRASKPLALLIHSALAQNGRHKHYKMYTQWIPIFNQSRTQQST